MIEIAIMLHNKFVYPYFGPTTAYSTKYSRDKTFVVLSRECFVLYDICRAMKLADDLRQKSYHQNCICIHGSELASFPCTMGKY